MCPAMQSSCQWFLIPHEQHFRTCLALPHFVNYAKILAHNAILKFPDNGPIMLRNAPIMLKVLALLLSESKTS